MARCRRWPFPPRSTRRCWPGSIGWGAPKAWRNWAPPSGASFAYALLRAVAPLEDAPLQRDLATLVAAELLYQRGQPPQAVYTFKHALVQEAAYESVLQARAPAHPSAHRPGAGGAVSRDSGDPARTAGPPCAAGGAVGQGPGLLPAGWGAGGSPLGLSGGGGRLRAGARSRAAPPGEPRHARAGHRSPPRAAQCALSRWASSGGSSSTYRKPKPSPRPWAIHTGWDGSLPICSPILWRHANQTTPSTSGQRALAIAADLGEVGLTVTAQYYLGNRLPQPGGLSSGGGVLPKERGVSPRRAAPVSASACLV